MIEISKEHNKPLYLMARSLLDNASGRKVKLIIKDCEGAKHTIYGKEIIHEDGGNVYTALLFGFEAASYDAIFVYHPDELTARMDDCETDIHMQHCDGVQLSALLCLIPAKVDVKVIDTKRDTGYKPREDYTSNAEFMLRNGGMIVDRVTTTNGGILIEVF